MEADDSMADNDFVTIEFAASFLRVSIDILHSCINSGDYEIDEKTIQGIRRFKLAHLKRIQDQDGSWGRRKETEKKLIAPISAVEEHMGIPKRSFLYGSAALLVSFANYKYAVDLSVGIAGAAAYDVIKGDLEKIRNQNEARKIFRRYFGLNEYSYDLGQKYPYGGYHRDHFKAFEGIKGASFRPIEASESSDLIRPPNDDHLLIGGPVSTPTVQKVWQYEGRSRVSKPILPLPFSFLIDDKDERTWGMEKFSWTFGDGTEKVPPSRNRLLIDSRRRNFSLRPEPVREDYITVKGEQVYLPYDNYLIITRIPNFLSEKFEQDQNLSHWGRLVFVQATHGIGTRAVDLLLTYKGKGPLSKMAEDVKGAKAFQAIFRISNPEKDRHNIDSFNDIDYVDYAIIDDDVKLSDYAKLRGEIYQAPGYSANI